MLQKLRSYWWWDYVVFFFVVSVVGVVCCGGSTPACLLAAWAFVTDIWAWLALAAGFGLTFAFVVLVRITTPRLRLESLSRLGWLNLIASMGVVVVLFLIVYLVG